MFTVLICTGCAKLKYREAGIPNESTVVESAIDDSMDASTDASIRDSIGDGGVGRA
jgi:hypothetical protein